MANAVVKVVERCNDAQENERLDLSECGLMQVPEAVYHLMRNTLLKSCNLSGNVIKKLSSNIALKFQHLTDINLSHNQIARLPDELVDLLLLVRLNISHNNFIVLPSVVFSIPNLRELDASHNAIIEVDPDQMRTNKNLEVVDLRHNPLSQSIHRKLENLQTSFRLEISEYNDDDF